jgi:hypothetical protein
MTMHVEINPNPNQLEVGMYRIGREAKSALLKGSFPVTRAVKQESVI